MLSQVTNFLKRNKKIMYYLGFFAVIYFALGDSVFADEKEMTFVEGLNYGFKFLSILIWLLTNFVGLFLNPSWTNGTVLGLQVHLKELWILVSNIVYFVFAILIVVIAFMNILGRWDKWELKQALPKFIVWVLIVPFSWFFIQVVISFSSILTASVLAIPNDTLKTVPLEKIMICSHLYIWDAKDDVTQKCLKEESAESILQWENIFWMLSVYTYGIFAIDSTTELFPKDVKGTVKTLTDLWFKSIFNLLFVLIYGILVISLALALFVRWIWLWLYMIFSPVFWLLYFFWKEKDWIGWKFSITEFLSLALVPVYVAWALSFWLLFIFVAWQGLWATIDSKDQWALIFSVTSTDKWSEQLKKDATDSPSTDPKIQTASGTTVVKLMNAFSVEMWGSLVNSWNDVNKIGQVLTWFKGSLWTLIMQLFGLAVLWISVMAALASNKITEQVVKPIAEFGSKVWQLAMKAPQYTPIFGGQSVASMTRVGQLWVQHYENKPQESAQQFVKDKGLFGASESAKLSAAITANTAKMWSPKDDASAIKWMVNSVTDANVLVQSWDFIEKLSEAMQRAKVPGHDKLSVWNTGTFTKALNDYEAFLDGSPSFENIFDRNARTDEFTAINQISDALKKWNTWEWSKSTNVKWDYKTENITENDYEKVVKEQKNITVKPTWSSYEFTIDTENTTDNKVEFYQKTDDWAIKHSLSTDQLSTLGKFEDMTDDDQSEWLSFVWKLSWDKIVRKIILKDILEKSGASKAEVIAAWIIEKKYETK